ncbi:MAG TPA: Uma2 family endonuclease [Gemmataceae bacterium]|nr:Uma2 family endonuclease [Gemmataceae bacterium]
MSTQKPRTLLRIEYENAAEAYLNSLPLEHFMEAAAQGQQRKITLESLDLVHARRADVQIFNELLVQYPRRGPRKIGQVVPDNMVVVWPEPIRVSVSYDIPLQPVGPLWMLEYVSKYNKRKDYEDNMQKYERELKVPYYLLFYPDAGELTLYRLRGRTYRSVPPNEQGRHAIEDLDVEVALLDEWVRFWYKGELLPLPADLQRDLDETRRQLRSMTRRAKEEHQARLAAEEEVQRLRAELERMRGRS